MMEKLGLWIPSAIQSDLMDLRNAVIHKNASVSRSLAIKALKVAEDLADHYQPLRT